MKVRFVPQNVEFDIKAGESVMHLAQDNGLYIKSVCKGVPSCAECRVRVIEGDHNVLPPGSEELSLIGTGHFIDRRRLSCQLKCFGDVTVDMSEQLAKQSGLIQGRKKKAAVKDDRVEEAVARRSEDSPEGSSADANEGEEPSADGTVRPQRSSQSARGPRDSRGGPARDHQPRDQQPRDRQANRQPDRQGDRPARQNRERSSGAGSPAKTAGAPSRPGGPAPASVSAPMPGQKAPGSQGQPRQPQAPRPPQQARAPGAAVGDTTESQTPGEGGAKKRRRRRGKGGGGSPNANGGGAAGGPNPASRPGGPPSRPSGSSST